MPNFMSIRHLVREVTRKVTQADEGGMGSPAFLNG